jgi:hypothetical protein
MLSHVIFEVSLRGESLLTPFVDALDDSRFGSLVTLHMPSEAKFTFELFVTMETSEVCMNGQHPLDFIFGSMCQLEVFSDLVAVPELLFAAAMAALEDSGLGGVVSRHVQLVMVVFLDVLAAQQASVDQASVRSRLVLVQIKGQLARVRAAREVAGVRPKLCVSLNVRRQVALFAENPGAHVARVLWKSHPLVFVQLVGGGASNRRREFATFEAFRLRGDQLIGGETLNLHSQFPPSAVDASAQVLLHRGHGGKLFFAHLADFLGVSALRVSESANSISAH